MLAKKMDNWYVNPVYMKRLPWLTWGFFALLPGMYVCTYVCMYFCMYMYILLYVHVYTSVCTGMYIRTYVRTSGTGTYVHYTVVQKFIM